MGMQNCLLLLIFEILGRRYEKLNKPEINMVFIQFQLKLKPVFSRNLEKLEVFVQSIILNHKRRRLYGRTVSELNDLSVRELSDMGLSRSMIRNVVYSGVYKGQYDRDNQI